MQISFFDGSNELKITKPIRLIELFAGYGSQALALKYLGANFEHHKISEWAVKSIQAYKDMHFTDDDTDYSQGLTVEELKSFLLGKISSNYNEPMTAKQINRLSKNAVRKIYNNMQATHNLGSIVGIKGQDLEITDTDKYTYIMTYSFPCQDLSSAGKMQGMAKDSGTRSGMLWEVERLLDELRGGQQELPQILLMENVPEVIGSNNRQHFDKWQTKLEELGYKNYYQRLNAKNYGIPQNRDRCFMVSILGNYFYSFPKEVPLKQKLADLLEDEVDEKFYLSKKALQGVINTKFECSKLENKMPKNDIIPTICARDYKDPKLVARYQSTDKVQQIGNIVNTGNWDNPQRGRICSPNGCCPTLNTCGGGGLEPKIVVENMKQQLCDSLIESGKIKEYDIVRHSYTNSRLSGESKDIRVNNLSPTLDTRCDCLGVAVQDLTTKNKRLANMLDKIDLDKTQSIDIYNQTTHEDMHCIKTSVDSANMTAITQNLRIRKLTPRECFRLMGVKDEDFDNVAKNQSNASLYHLAGDSIVVNVLMAIFEQML